ncbi:MAG: hypothetical protein R2699_16050 [Acidimicrobiales bacterium]
MAEEADRLGLEALALTDHDGCYGIVRFARRRALGLPTVFGSSSRSAAQRRSPASPTRVSPNPAPPGRRRPAADRPARWRWPGWTLAPGLPDQGRCLAGETHLVVLARPRGYALFNASGGRGGTRGRQRRARRPGGAGRRRGCPPPAPTATAGWVLTGCR